jgi:hypothetical protein
MMKIKNILLLIAVLCTTALYAQAPATTDVDMADGMRSSGKIYVVVGVVLIILAGLLLYLISIDRKVSKMEKEMKDNKK